MNGIQVNGLYHMSATDTKIPSENIQDLCQKPRDFLPIDAFSAKRRPYFCQTTPKSLRLKSLPKRRPRLYRETTAFLRQTTLKSLSKRARLSQQAPKSPPRDARGSVKRRLMFRQDVRNICEMSRKDYEIIQKRARDILILGQRSSR